MSQVLSYYPTIHATGPAEVVRMIDIVTPLVKGASKEPTDKRKQLFDEPVHITMDNFFSGDEVFVLPTEQELIPEY